MPFATAVSPGPGAAPFATAGVMPFATAGVMVPGGARET